MGERAQLGVQAQARIRLDVRGEREGQVQHHVHVAPLQRGQARRRVGDDLPHDALGGRLRSPVAGIGLDHDAVAHDVFDEAERARADVPVGDELVLELGQALGRRHAHGLRGEPARHHRVRDLGDDAHGVGIDDEDVLAEGRRPRELGQRIELRPDGALDGELDALRGELLPVVELHAAPELDLPRVRVQVLPRLGEEGLELHGLRVASQEPLAHQPEDRAGQDGPELVRVYRFRGRREGDGERGLLLRLGPGRAGDGGDGGTGRRRLEQITTTEHVSSWESRGRPCAAPAYFGSSARNSSTARLKASG